MLKRLDNVGIAVSNARRSLDFYINVLGFEGEVSDGEGSASLGGIALYIFESRSIVNPLPRSEQYYANPRGVDHLAFEVEDIDAVGRELASRGVVFLHDTEGAIGEFRYRGFHDPDGNMLYIIQRP